MIDHEVRFTPASQAARDHIRKGSIGAIKAVYVRPPWSANPFIALNDMIMAHMDAQACLDIRNCSDGALRAVNVRCFQPGQPVRYLPPPHGPHHCTC